MKHGRLLLTRFHLISYPITHLLLFLLLNHLKLLGINYKLVLLMQHLYIFLTENLLYVTFITPSHPKLPFYTIILKNLIVLLNKQNTLLTLVHLFLFITILLLLI